jgi:hypothetical protein
MAERRDPERGRLLALILVAIAASIALLKWDVGGTRGRLPDGEAISVGPSNEDDAGVHAIADHVKRPPPAGPACLPRAHKACHEGDVWWFDSCGDAEARAESCDARGCTGFSCATDEQPTNPCGTISAYGSCDGDLAKACVANQLVSVDCARRGERCVMTREGAGCLPRDAEHGCASSDRPACVGDRLRQCVDGRWAEIDCASRKASCATVDDEPRCLATGTTTTPPPAATVETCDGHDNDLDGRVDEAGACETVPLVAFVPATAKLANLEARMRDELTILNRVFAPLLFEWAKTVEVTASYRVFDPKEIERAALQLSQVESKAFAARLHATTTPPPAANGGSEGLGFYIPVLFAEKLRLEPPKAGISTLPNARCGGIRVSDEPSPPHGLVVLSEVRSRETLTHELGHYLGLCHTHEELSRYAVASQAPLSCQRSGDGICDTAPDPGPSQCLPGAACELVCTQSAAKPDASNIMSYYLACRRALTAEQIAEAERNLSLRRGWFRCLDPRDCPCEAGAPNACPPEMSCHPGASEEPTWSCELDGPALPGTPCRNASQCADGSVCIAQDGAAARCTRPCRSNDGCTCTDVGLPFRVCAEDLK